MADPVQVDFSAALTALKAGDLIARASWSDGATWKLFPGRSDSDPLIVKVVGPLQTSAPVVAVDDLMAADWIVTPAPAP